MSTFGEQTTFVWTVCCSKEELLGREMFEEG